MNAFITVRITICIDCFTFYAICNTIIWRWNIFLLKLMNIYCWFLFYLFLWTLHIFFHIFFSEFVVLFLFMSGAASVFISWLLFKTTFPITFLLHYFYYEFSRISFEDVLFLKIIILSIPFVMSTSSYWD